VCLGAGSILPVPDEKFIPGSPVPISFFRKAVVVAELFLILATAFIYYFLRYNILYIYLLPNKWAHLAAEVKHVAHSSPVF
jgi:hypothetical protein